MSTLPKAARRDFQVSSQASELNLQSQSALVRVSPFGYTGGRVNQLYHGDNLQMRREHIATKSVDLISLDPPFNSKRDHLPALQVTQRCDERLADRAGPGIWRSQKQ